VFGHHRAKGNQVLQLGGPDNGTVVDEEEEPGPGLDRHRIIPRFLFMQRQEVSINIAVHEEPVKLSRLQNHSLTKCALKMLVYLDEG